MGAKHVEIHRHICPFYPGIASQIKINLSGFQTPHFMLQSSWVGTDFPSSWTSQTAWRSSRKRRTVVGILWFQRDLSLRVGFNFKQGSGLVGRFMWEALTIRIKLSWGKTVILHVRLKPCAEIRAQSNTRASNRHSKHDFNQHDM